MQKPPPDQPPKTGKPPLRVWHEEASRFADLDYSDFERQVLKQGWDDQYRRMMDEAKQRRLLEKIYKTQPWQTVPKPLAAKRVDFLFQYVGGPFNGQQEWFFDEPEATYRDRDIFRKPCLLPDPAIPGGDIPLTLELAHYLLVLVPPSETPFLGENRLIICLYRS